jgi:hypothetical protein
VQLSQHEGLFFQMKIHQNSEICGACSVLRKTGGG